MYLFIYNKNDEIFHIFFYFALTNANIYKKYFGVDFDDFDDDYDDNDSTTTITPTTTIASSQISNFLIFGISFAAIFIIFGIWYWLFVRKNNRFQEPFIPD